MIYIYPQAENGSHPVKCEFENGSVWFIVQISEDGKSAQVVVYDEAVLVEALRNPEYANRNDSPADFAAKNKYGPGKIRKAIRLVWALFPDVKSVSFNRETGANPGSTGVRSHG